MRNYLHFWLLHKLVREKVRAAFYLFCALGTNRQHAVLLNMFAILKFLSLALTESFSRALGDAKVLNKPREPDKS